jgi:hypothetical protein
MPKKPRVYKYRLRPVAPPDYQYGQTLIRTGDQEVLSGMVQGMKASDLEERVARSHDKLEVSTQFRVRITSEALGNQRLTRQFANVRGEVEIDFLSEFGNRTYPLFVDGSIGHFFTAWQADADKLKTAVADEFGRQFGWNESIRIPFWKLIDQDMSDRTIRDIFV